MPIKPEEIAYYRATVTDKYVIEIQTMLEAEERRRRLNYERMERLKYSPYYKQCKRCGKIKHISGFYKNTLKFKGVFDVCKECCKTRKRERRMGIETNRKREANFADAVSAK